jgi:UDP-2-acetamido-3-amino-2,3-dideoxy-glucuronate N-acetyltransferase
MSAEASPPSSATASSPAAPRIHPTALVEAGVEIGPGTSVWDNVHIRGPAWIGPDCIIGEKTYIAYGVRIGTCVKINAHVYVCTAVTIEDRVMISAGVIFTNDRYPRAFAIDGDGLASSEPNEDTLQTVVREGATIGAGAVIGPGLEIGAYAMIGMGAVVTADVPAHALVYGNPARIRGHVCVCGEPAPQGDGTAPPAACTRCGRARRLIDDE